MPRLRLPGSRSWYRSDDLKVNRGCCMFSNETQCLKVSPCKALEPLNKS